MSITLESVEKINALKQGIEATTGESYNDLTEAVQGLKDGYGQSGGTEEIESLIDESGVLGSTEGTVEDKVEQLVDKAEGENAWYEYTKNMTSLPTGFKNTQIEKIPRMDYSKVSSLSYAFSNMPLKRVEYYINSDVCTNGQSAFQSCNLLEYVKGINTSNMTYAHDMFMACKMLKTIEEPFDFSSISPDKTTNNRPFGSCTALENVRFVAESIKMNIMIPNSKLLTAESIQSIIDGLAPVETAQTLTLNSAIVLTDEQKTAISNKGWTLVQ